MKSDLLYVIIILCLLLFVNVLWKRRWLYYYSWKLPGPFSMPLIGNPFLLLAGQKELVKTGLKLIENSPAVFRAWAGPIMFIFTSKANQVEFILNQSVHKDGVITYRLFDQWCTSLLTTNFDKWQPRRKSLNKSFNNKILNSFLDIQVKMANRMTKNMELYCGKSTDLIPALWNNTLDTIFETIGGVDVTTMPEKNSKFIPMFIRLEEEMVNQTLNPLYHIEWFWKLTPQYKNLAVLKELYMQQIRETIRRHQNFSSKAKDENDFISRIVNGDYSTKELEEELAFLFLAGSETSAVVVGNVLLAMSIYPDVQTKLYNEQTSLLNKELTLEDLNNLDYLERVIKETMRVLPAIPLVVRNVDTTFEIDGQVFPKGCNIIIPIQLIHRSPEYWSEPLKFDPNRFLPEEVEKRPRCSYLPFSFGSRNCIGLKYAMMNMKILLSKIIQNFEVLPGPYKSFIEIEMVYHIVQKPANGADVLLRKR